MIDLPHSVLGAVYNAGDIQVLLGLCFYANVQPSSSISAALFQFGCFIITEGCVVGYYGHAGFGQCPRRRVCGKVYHEISCPVLSKMCVQQAKAEVKHAHYVGS